MQAEKIGEISKLLLALIRQLVDHPDEVVVTSVSGPQGITIQVRLWPTDVGKVIGRGGRMAIALRIILNGIAKKIQSNLRLEIADS